MCFRIFAYGENIPREARDNRTGFRYAQGACGADPKRGVAIPNKNGTPIGVPFLFGAATRIRTGDLILTKDVLYQLSHSSVSKGIPS